MASKERQFKALINMKEILSQPTVCDGREQAGSVQLSR